jgi:hypothetical protein
MLPEVVSKLIKSKNLFGFKSSNWE